MLEFLVCIWNHEYFESLAKGFTLTLQETQSIHGSMNIPKNEFITYIYILYYQSSINFQFSPDLAGFPDILNKIRHNVGFGIAKTPNSVLNVMAIHVQGHPNVNKKSNVIGWTWR